MLSPHVFKTTGKTFEHMSEFAALGQKEHPAESLEIQEKRVWAGSGLVTGEQT
jgi:hypothetical protein